MDDANANLREGPTKDNASCFGVMTGCFALMFLLFSVLTVVALGKRWTEPSRASSPSSSRIEEPSSRAVSDPPAQGELQAWVKLRDPSKSGAAVRKGPCTRNKLIDELKDATPVIILDETYVTDKACIAGKWFKIRANGTKGMVVDGWMHSDIVKTN
jgi:hypothetical protein